MDSYPQERRATINGLRRQLAAQTQAHQAATARNAQLEEQLHAEQLAVQLWREAYGSLAASRALRVAQSVRAVAGRAGVGGGPNPYVDPRGRDKRIARAVRQRARGRETPAPEESGAGDGATQGGADSGRVRIGVASMPSRVEGLKHVVDRLIGQADELCVHLNGYSEVPGFLAGDSRLQVHTGEDLGDRAKFLSLESFAGYYFTVDDDIDYPKFYVDFCIDGIEKYDRKAVVGWHGAILSPNFSDYYDGDSRQVLSYRTHRRDDTFVHILGTGCAAFHTDTIDVSRGDFRVANMADVFFALEGQRQEVPFVVLAHRKGWALPLDLPNDASIYGDSTARAASGLNMRAEVNRLVSAYPSWTIRTAPAVQARSARGPGE